MGFWDWLGGKSESKGGGARKKKGDKTPQSLHFPPLPHLQITLEYKKIKHIILKIKSFNTLSISAPFGVGISEIESVLYKREQWIHTKLLAFPQKVEERYCNSGEIFYLGESYKVSFSPSHRASITLNKGEIRVEARSEGEIEAVVQKWQRGEAKRVFEEVLGEWERELEVQISHLSIKKMASRWGSCNPKKGYINLNLSLIKMPKRLIEYVALHEMIHFFHYYHDKNFYAMMSQKMPDWKERELELREWKRRIEV